MSRLVKGLEVDGNEVGGGICIRGSGGNENEILERQ